VKFRPAGKKGCLTIFKKLEILDYHASLGDLVTAKVVNVQRRFPESVSHWCQIGWWKRRAEQQYWKCLPVDVQKKYREVPNYLRTAMRVSDAKGQRLDCFLPLELQIEFDKMLTSRVQGCTSVKQVREMLKPANLVIGMKSLIARRVP